MLKYCLDRYKTLELCDKAVDYFLPALKFVPDWFVTSKMVRNFIVLNSLIMIYAFLMKILVMLLFLVIKLGILSLDLNNINPDNVYFDEDNPETIIHIRLMA